MAVDVKQHRVTVEEFMAFTERPENSEAIFELIEGEIFEVPSNPYSSKIAAKVLILIGIYLEGHDIGHITGEAGGYMVNGQRFAPDVSFISYARQPEIAHKGYNPNPPELAVEVISDTDSADEARRLRLKLSNYLAVGTVVWVVNTDNQTVEVHHPTQGAQVVGADGVLTLEAVLPGFSLAVASIFPAKQD